MPGKNNQSSKRAARRRRRRRKAIQQQPGQPGAPGYEPPPPPPVENQIEGQEEEEQPPVSGDEGLELEEQPPVSEDEAKAPEMDMEQATQIVLEDQNAFMRGELDPLTEEWLKTNFPQTIPDWVKMKANMKTKLRKIRKNLRNLIRRRLERFRPGKKKTLRRKEEKRLNKLEGEFDKQGLGLFMTWTELFEELVVELGAVELGANYSPLSATV